MKTYSVIILESNLAIVSQLKAALAETKNFNVVYCGDDGDEGIKEILKVKPDLVMLGIFLKGTDGCGVLREVKKTCPEIKVIAMGISNDSLIERIMADGAEYYLIKPFAVSVAIERVYECLNNNSAQEDKNSFKKRTPVTIEEKISEIFISIGIPPHINGYGFLREGIKLTIEQPTIINCVTKKLYPSIAKKFSTTPSKVERAIRHAIEVAWNRGRIDVINAIFGARIYLGAEKPTNSEFIALVADKLILENLG